MENEPACRVLRGPCVHPGPRVSVVVAAYAPRWLDEALDSVRAQTFRDWELVVVDDGSPVPVSPGERGDVVLVRQANRGPGGARNRGVQLARGSLVALLDTDDRWLPHKLERQVRFHDEHPDVLLTCTAAQTIDARGRPVGPAPQSAPDAPVSLEALFVENPLTCCTTMIRRDAWLAAGGMAEASRMGEDYGLWLRLACRGPIVRLGAVLAERRLHAEGLMEGVRRDGTWLAAEERVYRDFLREHPELRGCAFVQRALARAAYEHGWHRLEQHAWDAARAAFWSALWRRPGELRAWRGLARAVLRVAPRGAQERNAGSASNSGRGSPAG